MVFLDETGTHLGFTRLFARALRGQRAIGSAPRNRGKTLSLISSMSLEGIKADFVIEGGVSGDVFVTYVRKVLLKCLKPGQVVVMDNLAAHHRVEVTQLIEWIGCEVLFLPSYSPDFNPIEHFFSWLKTFLRGLAARNRDVLVQGIVRARRMVSSDLIFGWFTGCGYTL